MFTNPICVALDTPDAAHAAQLARTLRGQVGLMKVGMEQFYAQGRDGYAQVAAEGVPVFLDLKLHDIPNTVERAVSNCAALGVDLLTVHSGGGLAMLEAAARGAAQGTPPGLRRPRIVAVTVLTSLDDAALAALGMPGPAEERVAGWASLARSAGCDGVVCSPREVARLRHTLGPQFVLVTPGIRPAGAEQGDQRRVATPSAAIAAGASYLVIGRPITAAADPVAAAEAIIEELEDINGSK